MSARSAANSAANDSKNAANEYETPKMIARLKKAAPTMTQAYRGSVTAIAWSMSPVGWPEAV
jgi:hypothetical protein